MLKKFNKPDHITITLDKDLHDQVGKFAFRAQMSKSEWVRDAILNHINLLSIGDSPENEMVRD